MIRYPAPEVVEFATKLGYSTEQLSHVLNTIGVDSRMVRVYYFRKIFKLEHVCDFKNTIRQFKENSFQIF